MAVPYYLVDNPLTPDPKDFRAQLQLKGTKKRIDIVKRIMIKIALVKIVNGISVPVITVFEDMISQTNNERITPGKSAKIFGDKLKFDAADADQGIFFIKDDETETRVEEYTEVGNKKTIFNIPTGLTAGDYTLQVIGKTTSGELRVGELQAVLNVA